MTEQLKYIHFKVSRFWLRISMVATITFIVAFVGGYYFATYRQVGYESGYVDGFTRGVNDLYTFNTQPEKWLPLERRVGVAYMNGTTAIFTWINQANQTKSIPFISTQSLGNERIEHGILTVFVDPISLPDQLAKAMNLQQRQHFIFTANNSQQQYLLILG